MEGNAEEELEPALQVQIEKLRSNAQKMMTIEKSW